MFIENSHVFFQNLEVYADGSFGCGSGGIGEARDFASFREWLNRGAVRVNPSSRPGRREVEVYFSKDFSFTGLGSVKGVFEPIAFSQDLVDWIELTLAELDPAKDGPLELRQGPVEAADPKIRELVGLRYERLSQDGRWIAGQMLSVLYRAEGEWFVGDLLIFSDGRAQLGRNGEVVDFEEIIERFRDGQVFSKVSPDQWLNFDGLGRLKTTGAEWRIKPEDLLAQAQDILERLRGAEGRQAFCLGALRAYQDKPEDGTFEILKWAYEQTPPHMRIDLNGWENVIRAYIGLPRVFDFIDYCPYAGPGPQPRAELVRTAK